MAVGDIDNDGQMEILINNQGERPSLLKDARNPGNSWITIQLQGTSSNRSAIGARVRVVAGAVVQTDEVRSGGGYISQSDLRLHFGLANRTKVDRIEIRWPSGRTQELQDVPAKRILTVREPA